MKTYADLLLVEGHGAQEQFLPHRGEGAAHKIGHCKHVGLERMRDYVCGAVQIEPELVGLLYVLYVPEIDPGVNLKMTCPT